MDFSFSDHQKTSTWEELGILSEVKFKSSLSGGKGGQNVNKVNSKAELYWTPANSYILNEEIKSRLLLKLGDKLSNEGELRITSEEERSLIKNKQKAIEKFYKLLTSCFKVNKKRKSTKPTKSSVKKRLNEKSIRKDVKEGRKKPDF